MARQGRIIDAMLSDPEQIAGLSNGIQDAALDQRIDMALLDVQTSVLAPTADFAQWTPRAPIRP